MKRLAAWLLAALAAWTAYGLDYKTVDVRKTGQSPVRETFWAGDSIAFGYALEEGGYSYDLEPWDMVTWELCTYTNPAQCWMAVTGSVDDAESGELSVETTLPLSVVPEGQYRGYVKGLNVTESNTVSKQRVLVEQVVTVRYGQTEFPPDVEDNGDIIDGNAYVRQSALDAEAEARIGGDAALSNAVAAITGDPAYYGGMVVKTNEAWVIDQQEDRTALEWNGTPVLEAVAPTNSEETAEGPVMVAGVPLYAGSVAESNRVATLGDIGVGKSYLPAEPGEEEGSWVVGDDVEFTGGVRLDSLAMGESVWHKLPTLADLNENDELADELEKYGADVDAEDAWNFQTPNVPRWQGTNLATTAEVARVAANVAENARGVASNRIGVAKVNQRIEGLWGECRGGWKWPDYFLVSSYVTGAWRTDVTNIAPPFVTNTEYNVIETLSSFNGLSGWQILTKIIRQADESDSIAWVPFRGRRGGGTDKTGSPVPATPSISPALLEISGSYVSFKEGVSPADVDSDFAAVRGTLGSYTIEQFLDYDASKQATNGTICRFVGPAPGSFLAHCYSNILVTASNKAAQGKDMGVWVWPNGYGGGTNHVPARINTNCWAYGMGDFTCVSYHTDTRPGYAGGVYRPMVMVTPRHAVCANHWKPIVGSNVYWVTKSGGIATNRVLSYYNIRSDLTVARMEQPFDTNEVGTATLLAEDFHHYVYGSTNFPVYNLFGVPCLSFDCAERVRVSFWKAAGIHTGRGWTDSRGRGYDDPYYTGSYEADGLAYGGWDVVYDGPYKGNGGAVGGDSGSPSFLIADGKAILLGCFHTAPGGGPMPHKIEVDAVIRDIWNDPEECQEYSIGAGGWTNPDAPQPPH